ncbi:FtsQ-type POTRA domain-containing protein [Pelagibacteraceae bacterium]|jgi:cell division protein FtsQ|nr:FtsQ-type POTRA domain-containing protein [Pelagibacteraceae bacterium]
MKKRLAAALLLLLLFSSYKPQKFFLSNKFKIEEIKIENNYILKDGTIKKKLIYLYDANLFFLDNTEIKKTFEKVDFIESFEIKKIYPNKLKIKIFEKKPIAILHHNKKRFYISENIDLIKYIDIENYRDLPTVFGKKENFKILYENLKKINFPLDLIKKYYLYESNRWDLETYQKKVVKLPAKNYIKSLENFMNLQQKNNFGKYKVFDYRINNQLILR